MKVGNIIKEIREKNLYTLETLSKKIGFSSNFISMVEKGKRKPSEKLLLTLIQLFPSYTNKLLEAYTKESLPKELQSIFSKGSFKDVTEEVKEYELKVYNFITDSDGKINVNEYENIKMFLDEENKKNIIDNGFVVKIIGNNMQPYFFEGDIVSFLKKKFESWQSLDSKLVLVKIKNDFFIKKIFFQNGKAFLFSFNERLYPEFEIDDTVNFVAVLKSQLQRNIEKFKF